MKQIIQNLGKGIITLTVIALLHSSSIPRAHAESIETDAPHIQLTHIYLSDTDVPHTNELIHMLKKHLKTKSKDILFILFLETSPNASKKIIEHYMDALTYDLHGAIVLLGNNVSTLVKNTNQITLPYISSIRSEHSKLLVFNSVHLFSDKLLHYFGKKNILYDNSRIRKLDYTMQKQLSQIQRIDTQSNNQMIVVSQNSIRTINNAYQNTAIELLCGATQSMYIYIGDKNGELSDFNCPGTSFSLITETIKSVGLFGVPSSRSALRIYSIIPRNDNFEIKSVYYR